MPSMPDIPGNPMSTNATSGVSSTYVWQSLFHRFETCRRRGSRRPANQDAEAFTNVALVFYDRDAYQRSAQVLAAARIDLR